MGLLDIFIRKKITPASPDFKAAWDTCEIDPKRLAEVVLWSAKIYKNLYRYNYVAEVVILKLGLILSKNELELFARTIGAFHYREANCDFTRCFHNGDKIIGNGKKTVNVPAGRGPFNDWEESAIDSLIFEKGKLPKKFDIYSMLEFSERYNGTGYRSKIGDHGVIELSPYVWAGTNKHDETSKYTGDGKYNPNAPEKQLGVAALLKDLEVRSEKLSVA